MQEILSDKVLMEKSPERKMMNRIDLKDTFSLKNASALVAFTLGIYLLFQIGRSVEITYQKLEMFHQARGEVQALRIENIELILLSEKVTSVEYVEESARNRLNYAKDGETLFIIPKELLNDDRITQYVRSYDASFVKETDNSLGKTPFQIWVDFFRFGV